jgi:hypothetical protein
MAEIWTWLVSHWSELLIFGAIVTGGYKIAIEFREMKRQIAKTVEASTCRRKENSIILEALQACLDGLHQQGCNGMVTQTSQKLKEFLINSRE